MSVRAVGLKRDFHNLPFSGLTSFKAASVFFICYTGTWMLTIVYALWLSFSSSFVLLLRLFFFFFVAISVENR